MAEGSTSRYGRLQEQFSSVFFLCSIILFRAHPLQADMHVHVAICLCRRTLRLLSWNIEGLDERDLEERTTAVCQIILVKQPHVVFLQEVIGPTLSILQRKLSKYHVFAPSVPPVAYFVVILIKQDPTRALAPGSLTSHSFPGSCMGRQLIKLPLSFHGTDYLLLASHLESMKDYSAERKIQLRAAFDAMMKAKGEGKFCIFGGDLNIREAEVKSVKVPDGILDAWQVCGSKVDTKFTWDLKMNDNLDWPYPSRPQARYDRVYCTSPGGALKPTTFELVGQDRLHNCDRFPSDHWGMWVEFDI